MSLTRTWMLLLAVAAALLAAAPSAAAKPGYSVFAGYRSISLSLEGSNGYGIRVEKRGHRIGLLAAGERSTVVYVALASVPKGSDIETRFPGLGRISVRFRPQGAPRHRDASPAPGCKGGDIVEQRGFFVGTIRFRGEQGYTRVRAKRAPGLIQTARREVCKGSMDEGPDPKGRTELLAISKAGGRTVSFDASKSVTLDVASTTTFGATVAERRRGMAIYRSTFTSGKARELLAGDTRPFPLSATVTPPAPFSGSAEYERAPDGERTWTGSLTVSLPGLGPVALAGPSFDASLCQFSGCTGTSIDGHSLQAGLDRRVDDHRHPE